MDWFLAVLDSIGLRIPGFFTLWGSRFEGSVGVPQPLDKIELPMIREYWYVGSS